MSVPANDTPLPARDGSGDPQLAAARLGVLDHHHGVGAARHHAAGGDRHGRARPNHGRRHDAGVNRLRRRAARRAALPRTRRTCLRRRRRSHRRSSDRTTARRRARRRRRPARGRARRRAAPSRRRAASRSSAARKRRSASSRSRTWRNCSCSRIEPDRPRRLPAAKPSLSSATMTKPSARVVDESTDAPPTASGSTRAVDQSARGRSRAVRSAS